MMVGMRILVIGSGGREHALVKGLSADPKSTEIHAAPGSAACNPAFDVTPARLVTGLITERGVAPASAEGLSRLFPDLAQGQAA